MIELLILGKLYQMDDSNSEFTLTWVAILVPLQILIWPITLLALLISQRARLKFRYIFGPVGFLITATIVWGWDFYLAFGLGAIFIFAGWLSWQLLAMQK